jgi:predicted amidophosphoribosyltransferase
LVDDIITTGLTFTHAINTMSHNGKNVLACLALADVGLD